MKSFFISLFFVVFFTSITHAEDIVVNCPECGHNITITVTASGATTAVHGEKSTTKTSGQCQATTQKGTQCSRKAAEGSNYCWQHKEKTESSKASSNTTNTTTTKTTNGASTGGRCRATTRSGNRCSRTATNNGYCWQHAK